MPLEGFDARFEDFPDYILGITREIWEDRGIGTLRGYYAPNIVVRSPSGVVHGNGGVIAATMATLAEFPDRQLLGEDVIWSHDATHGYLSSHRIISTATHSGNGVYGEATGRRLEYRIIADCAARQNQIYDEWLVRDQGAIVRQLELDPRRYAADQIEAEGGPERAAKPYTTDADPAPPAYGGSGNSDDPGPRYESLLTGIMAADFDRVRTDYDRAAQLELPGGVTGYGWEAATDFWIGLRSSFPNASFSVQHRIGRDEHGFAPRAAIRWSMDGLHDGWGRFGAPTAAPVHVMGISHAEFGPRGVRREWVLFDETAIWKQILLHTG